MEQQHPTYNSKTFLLPNSINSSASVHAKITEDGQYRFRIHDCLAGVRLHGSLATKNDRIEAMDKLLALAREADAMAEFIFKNF